MSAATVHPTALVEPGAVLGEDAEIGAFSVIGSRVSIGAGTRIGPHVVITGDTSIGANNRIFQFASIGEIAQDRKYGGEPASVVIGDNNVIREYVSIHSGTAQDRKLTEIGNANWLLAYVHIAHDCRVGNNTTFSNNAQLAGHVQIDDYVTLGGFTGVHQFCRIGAHAMIAAGAIVLQDVPPYVTVAGSPARPYGTNNEGLRRRGFEAQQILSVRQAYKTLYRRGLTLDEAKAELAQQALHSAELQPMVDFLEASKRGLVR